MTNQTETAAARRYIAQEEADARRMNDRQAARVMLHSYAVRYAAENLTTTAQVYAVARIRQAEIDRFMLSQEAR